MNNQPMKNRDKIKRKKNSNIQRNILIFLFVFIIILIISFNNIFKIDTIIIKGNKYYSEEEIIKLINLDHYQNTILYYLTVDKKEFDKIPFIEMIDIKLTSFQDIEVSVYEKKVIGCIEYMGMYMYIDKDGLIVESSKEQLDDIPIIQGLNFEHLILYDYLPIKDKTIINDILNIIQLLDKYYININTLIILNNKEFTLIKDDLRILLGTKEQINEKIIKLKDILKDSNLENEKGELNLKHINHRIYFKKDV
ncbi:MAG: cell division protein FtsQ/DivIB [bacterium]